MNNEVAKKNIVKQRPTLEYIRYDGADKSPHEHDYPELIFVAEGSGRFETNENQYPIKAGDLIICSKNVPHSEYMFDSPESEIYHLGIKDIILSGMRKNELIEDPFCIIHTQDDSFAILKGLFLALKCENDNLKLCGKLIEDDALRLLIVYSLRLAVSDMSMLLIQNKAFFEAKSYFDKNFLNIISIEDVCKKLNINKFYLTHIFKEQLGMPPIRYLQFKRMEKAKQHISNGLSINETANRCGYTDTAYFCRVFKKIVGVTPLKYRSQVKQ